MSVILMGGGSKGVAMDSTEVWWVWETMWRAGGGCRRDTSPHFSSYTRIPTRLLSHIQSLLIKRKRKEKKYKFS